MAWLLGLGVTLQCPVGEENAPQILGISEESSAGILSGRNMRDRKMPEGMPGIGGTLISADSR
jgi:hypothetical protein